MNLNPVEILTRPLTAEEIEWKIIASKNGITTIAPYIDARAVMARLDRAFGPFGWRVSYRFVHVRQRTEEGGEAVEWGVIATIAIRDPETGEWVAKEDGAGPSDMEPIKGALSGALKRAATAWGIGRELYSYPRVLVEGEHRYIPSRVLERLKGLPQAVAEGKPLPEVIRLTPEGTSATRKAG